MSVRIELVGSDDCSPCRAQEKEYKQHGILFSKIDAENDPSNPTLIPVNRIISDDGKKKEFIGYRSTKEILEIIKKYF